MAWVSSWTRKALAIPEVLCYFCPSIPYSQDKRFCDCVDVPIVTLEALAESDIGPLHIIWLGNSPYIKARWRELPSHIITTYAIFGWYPWESYSLLKDIDEEWIWRGEVKAQTGREWGKINCSQDVIYKRRIKIKKENTFPKTSHLYFCCYRNTSGTRTWVICCLLE